MLDHHAGQHAQPPAPALPAALIERAAALCTPGQRRLLGICGAPGAGKSTFAEALLAALGDRAAIVPMDGFHLSNRQLSRLGRMARKGAPDTFDIDGYLALLQRLRHQRTDEVVYAPAFEREIEEPVAGAIAVQPEVELVITEGNYLLLEQPGWNRVATMLDQSWFLDVDDSLRRERLEGRHRRFGRSPEAARDWIEHTDEPNARLIAASRGRAGLIVGWGD
ncbi:nucleoside/nucleotide kinase family protein [Halotalea alkalilenta]|uniref:Nucleoside/nucleotide kinase family protein n=1 Tax=Halotalea alkalilenta TaxID=376489 RepID=A0A172YEE3_9GAMM|nr:nucleoside/nucleotide kinase family protein [Halotalea alkalilenta]ANF57462.1 nucleoside/nucleotide kinase family protein [Halotalea alkalilenta]